MASRLTDKQKKKIIADYVESGSYRATAKKFGVSDNTVKNICAKSADIGAEVQHKKKNRIQPICWHIWIPEKNKHRVLLINILKSWRTA